MKFLRKHVVHFVEYDPTGLYSRPSMLWWWLMICTFVTLPVTFAYPSGSLLRLLLIPALVVGMGWAAYLSFGTSRKVRGCLLFWCVACNLLLVPGCLLTAYFAASRAGAVHPGIVVVALLGIVLAYALTVASTFRRIARDGYGTAWAKSATSASAGALVIAALVGISLARLTDGKMSQSTIALVCASGMLLLALLGVNGGVVTFLKLYFSHVLAGKGQARSR